ncbi:PREDICTED: protein FAR1-RELATED SEQUENCE 5-like [Fragaria vesca subsp. vesca]
MVKLVSSRSRRLSRQKCLAQFTVKYDRKKEGYYASSFRTEHNHPLTRLVHRQFMRTNRLVKEHDIAQVNALRKVSVGTARPYEFLVHQAGGHEFVGFTIRDLYNRVQEENNKLLLDGDAQCSIMWMNMKAIRDPMFYCLFSADVKGRLANMFWRDGQSYTDYCSYGDVLIFDSTYKTNMYGKPLVVLWERTTTEKKPVSVITDSDEAMRKALGNVMPEARHRLCAWHVGKNVVSHLKDAGTRGHFFHLIFAGLSIEDWETSWEYFVTMNKLRG